MDNIDNDFRAGSPHSTTIRASLVVANSSVAATSTGLRLVVTTLLLLDLHGCGPARSTDFRQRVEHACKTSQVRQAHLEQQYGLGAYEHYDWYQDRGVIVFSTRGVPKVVAEIQFVGSTSKISNTWLWAWANSTIDERLSQDSLLVRGYGKRARYEKLTTAKWVGYEVDGWEMASLQAEITGAEGIYRSPDKNGATFLTLKHVRWARSNEPYRPAPREQ